jgi:hypothetical protein
MAEEKKEPEKKDNWITWLALTTAFLAVFAAITTMFMGKYSTRAILAQGHETDQWAYYQAKSIKGHTYEIQKQKLELEFSTLQGRMSGALAEKYKKTIADYDKNIKKYDKEKAEIMADARALAKKKDLSQEMSGNLSLSLIFLQIAIVLSSVAAITKKKPLWYVGLAISAGWIIFFANAYLLIF